jgi:hypothetical protein
MNFIVILKSKAFNFFFLIIKVLSIYTFFARQEASRTASLKSINSNINFIQKFMHNATVIVYFKICALNIYNIVFPLEVKTRLWHSWETGLLDCWIKINQYFLHIKYLSGLYCWLHLLTLNMLCSTMIMVCGYVWN